MPITTVLPVPEYKLRLPEAGCTVGAVTVVNVPVLAVPPPMAPGAAKVAPLSDDAFRFATFVVELTVSGAVPVETVDVSVVPPIVPLTSSLYAGVVVLPMLRDAFQ